MLPVPCFVVSVLMADVFILSGMNNGSRSILIGELSGRGFLLEAERSRVLSVLVLLLLDCCF